ncbi:MAG: dienelactone hydrolase family protein [Polaromonas sp.]|nr:dienelactone hydrolase family protein [Polaromonas sp.]
MSNTVFKPAGDGPFPAVVLLHSCGGIAPAHIRTHAKEMLQAGFAVLVLDSHGPRGFDTCRQKLIPFAVGAMDAYAGLQHLARHPFVHQQRIYFAGYSYGGSVAALLASPQSAAVFASPLRFKASAAHYANCVRPSGARLVLPDTDRPLLMLMGQADTESPPNSCFPLLADMQTAGAPVSWHVYPGLTHGWDRVDGSANGYVYNEAGSIDATRRMLAFFDASR